LPNEKDLGEPPSPYPCYVLLSACPILARGIAMKERKYFLWAIVRTNNPRMPQASFFFPPEMAEEDAKFQALEYVRMIGIDPRDCEIDFTGGFWVENGLIVD
jgi:hypothetical protein